MKKIILIAVVLVFIFLTFMIIEAKATKKQNIYNKNSETRAVYFSYIEFNSYIKGKNSQESKNNIKIILDNIKNMNLNTVIVHVRPFADSIYKSEYYSSESSS